MTRNLCILGSTGSVGTRAVEIASELGINICALSAGKNIKLLEKQTRKFKPEIISVLNEKDAKDLKIRLADTSTQIVCKREGILEVASFNKADMVLNAVSGIAGLEPTFAAINAKKNISMANKETIVSSGNLMLKAARENNIKIIPVDSEHSAIFQCLECHSSGKNNRVKKILLTASGGPFFGKKRKDLKNVTINQALNHPNWKMGKRITIDSASLMNKGFELIEAVNLFEISQNSIEILIHKESIIHSMVEYFDNSVIAQASATDIGVPIQYALTWPKRTKTSVKELDFIKISPLTFQKPDKKTFRLLDICKEAIDMGGTAPAFLSSVDEIAVELFLNSKVSFLEMMDLIEETFKNYKPSKMFSLNDVLRADQEARALLIEKFNKLRSIYGNVC